MRIIKYTLSLAIAGMMTVACAQNKKNSNADAEDIAQNTEIMTKEDIADYPTIVGVASSNEQFSTLVTAVAAANLVRTLESDGPFTVFAPTNEAFEKLPSGTVETLLKPENKDQLTSILVYHVIAGEYKAADVIKAIKDNDGSFTVETVEGSTIVLSLQDGAVVLTDANGNTSTVIIPDVNASNGVIHAIDSVIMPAK
jgi:uncharacterized surface protein with fasciclin (FAS1) repeats